MGMTVQDITKLLRQANQEEFEALARSLAADERKGVRKAIETARNRLASEAEEQARLESLYAYQREIAESRGGSVVVGLDEVGRGPVAGPLAVGAVVLPDTPRIPLLNDSKQLTPAQRETIAATVKDQAIAYAIEYIEPGTIDAIGMTLSLKRAFTAAIADIEAQGVHADVVLLDGNPLHIDPREVNVVKGDAKCAAIAAASIIAKVERDALMCKLDEEFPGYGFAGNKGYASQEHIDAIRMLGLSPVHRRSFCKSFLQETLF